MLRTSATSGIQHEVRPQSQSSVAVSAPKVIPAREPVTSVVRATEPEAKVSEPQPTTESNTFMGLPVWSDADVHSFQKTLSGRPVSSY